MANKLKFFGIYENCYDYNRLNDDQQKKILINKKIYIEGFINEPFDKNLIHPFYFNPEQNINFLGNDFELNNKNYTLNHLFINEVYEQIIKKFEENRVISIDNYIDSLNLKLNFIDNKNDKNIFLSDQEKKAKMQYSEKLGDKIFQDFHKLKNEVPNLKELVIKKHLRYDITHLSDYIFGIDNIQNFLAISEYYTFLRTTSIINFCDINYNTAEEETESKKPSLPKAIAMLHEIGFFELEKLKNLNDTSIAKIISFIQMKEMENSTNTRAISGNIRVLNPKNKEDGLKYTSHKWLEYSKNKFNEIKKGNN